MQRIKFGKFQYKILSCLGVFILSEGAEQTVLSILLPVLENEMNLSTSQ
jgi:hypothetical protein